ncbi:MAG TPA: aminotransferase class I/II-fold pyridoxal phosphate-dependent enzyme [Mycobacterium sp.]
MTTRIHLSRAEVTEVEEKFVIEALRSGWIAPLGPDVDAFESEVAEYVGAQGALALSSGTAALHLALLEMGARPGRVVLVPTMTFAATANAVIYTGAEPVFVDSQATDGNVDPELLLHAIDSLRAQGADIAAVILVDLFGRCADYPQILPEMEARGIPVVSDAAESLGASVGGRRAGSFGRAAALSFNGNKIMTTSGGGMLLSDDLAFLDRCRYLATQARQPVGHYEHTEIGYNYRLSNILAALGRGQLSRLDSMIERRREIRGLYVDALGDVPGIRFLGRDRVRTDREDNCWLTALVMDPRVITATFSTVIAALAARNIEARPLWKPMHLQPVFLKARAYSNSVSIRLFNTGISLPSGSALTDEHVLETVETVRRAIIGCSR